MVKVKLFCQDVPTKAEMYKLMNILHDTLWFWNNNRGDDL